MAEEDQENKTEAASAKQLQRAWDEGRVPLARDLPLVASLAAAAAALVALGGALRSGLVRACVETMNAVAEAPFRTLPHLAAGPAAAAAAVCAATATASALVTLAQTQGRFWAERPLPDLSRLMRGTPLGRLFSRELLTDLGIAAVKVVALGWAAWSSVHGDFLTLSRLLGAAPSDQLAQTFGIVLRAGWRMLLVATAVAGLDLAVVRLRFTKQMRMTKAEAKREAREEDGDPLLKGKRKQRHRQLARGRARVEVPRADALLVNPTHIAIALRYRRDEGKAPRVTAKGKGVLAEYMRELAR